MKLFYKRNSQYEKLKNGFNYTKGDCNDYSIILLIPLLFLWRISVGYHWVGKLIPIFKIWNKKKQDEILCKMGVGC